MKNDYILYQSPISYYSGKVRAFLRYKALPFSEELSSDRVASRVIKPATGGWRVIPVLRLGDGSFLQDSSLILDKLDQLHPQRRIVPQGVKQQTVSALFELLGDEWLLFPAMHYRWAYKKENLRHILRAFGGTRKPHWPESLQWLGGVTAALLFGNVAPMVLGLNKKNVPAMQRWTEQVLDQLDLHFSQSPYLLGGRACHGDFGLFGPLYAHLYLDPYPRQHLIDVRPHLKAWIERMNQTPEDVGEWLQDDAIPDTLLPILQWQQQDQLPFLQATLAKTQEWMAQHDDADKLPRFLGKVDYSMNGASGRRMCTPYSQWMFERVSQGMNSADAANKKTLGDWMEQQGLSAWLVQPELSVSFHRSRLWRTAALPKT